MQSGWNAEKRPVFSGPDSTEVDLVWFIRAIKCPAVGKPLLQSSVISSYALADTCQLQTVVENRRTAARGTIRISEWMSAVKKYRV